MRGLLYVLLLVLSTGLVVACDRDEESGGFATAPSLASASGQCSNLNSEVQAAFNGGTSETINEVKGLAQSMVQAFGTNQHGKATWYGFKVLEAIETTGRSLGTPLANSNLAVGTFKCMKLGTATLPTNLTIELGGTGAFGVRGRPATDNVAVVSHNGIWIIEPPVNKSWQSITTLPTRTGIDGDTANLMLVLGKPGSSSNFVGTGDQLLSGGTFDWTTITTATFGNPFVVVGSCVEGGGFLQHFPAKNSNGTPNSNAEIFGFVEPTQCPGSELTLERAPQTLAERLFRAISPTPAYATALLGKTGGGSKPALSPFGIINPGKVNLGTFFQSPKKSGNLTNKPLDFPPIVKPTSNGGVAFKQTDVLVYLQPIVNNGTPGRICFNWAYNDDQGVADFLYAVYTKAGGLSLVATSKGTSSAPAPTGEDVPQLQAGAAATSTQFNVKNDGSALKVCPVFDGTTYFTNILNPAADKFTFDPAIAGTFPPNYDVVAFPGYQF
jgi:hypothetical protein